MGLSDFQENNMVANCEIKSFHGPIYYSLHSKLEVGSGLSRYIFLLYIHIYTMSIVKLST